MAGIDTKRVALVAFAILITSLSGCAEQAVESPSTKQTGVPTSIKSQAATAKPATPAPVSQQASPPPPRITIETYCPKTKQTTVVTDTAAPASGGEQQAGDVP